MYKFVFVGLSVMGIASSVQAAANCTETVQQPVRATLVAPLSGELVSVNTQLGAPSGVLASAYDETLSVDHVLLRQRVEACKQVEVANIGKPPATASANATGYKPKTQYDNTPYRFSMTQNGKKMTADDFDAWLKATGYSAGRRAEEAKPAEQPAAEGEKNK
jgi:hypothetical protein